jgi:DNA-binding helix-hairpin-helix protein with protein kinase domain
MTFEPGTAVLMRVPRQVKCPVCVADYNEIATSLEAVVTDRGEFLGIQAVVRFQVCGHRVPNATASPSAIGLMLEEMAHSEDGI